jgi:riboflavin synthase
MFSGIVESVQPIPSVQKASDSPELASLVRIQVKKPSEFNDLRRGDSVAIDGICLTVENFDEEHIGFALAAETLKILGKNQDQLAGKLVNLERSLRFGDRIHGHLVTGHVDSLGLVTRSEAVGENWFLDVEISNGITKIEDEDD